MNSLNLTKGVAEWLAKDCGFGYRAKKTRRGMYMVWCDASDHYVEFDAQTITRAVLAIHGSD